MKHIQRLFVSLTIFSLLVLIKLTLSAEIGIKVDFRNDESTNHHKVIQKETNSTRTSRFFGRQVITSNTQYSFAAFIRVFDSKFLPFQTCSGALITRGYVLTAASCLIDGAFWDVSMGLADPDNAMAMNLVTSLGTPIIYPHFERNTHEHDIALLKVSPFVLQDTIGIISLPSSKWDSYSTRDFEGKMLRLVGYGTLYDGDPFDAVRNFVDMQAMDSGDCSSNMKKLQYKLFSHQSCLDSASGSVGACKGDLGAPVIIWNSGNSPRIVGVVSDYIQCNSFALFTRIGPYLTWIRQHTSTTENTNSG